MQQLGHEREHLTAHSRHLETEWLRCQSAVRSLEAQVVQFFRLSGMIEVQRQTSNTLQAEVLRLGGDNLQVSQIFDTVSAR